MGICCSDNRLKFQKSKVKRKVTVNHTEIQVVQGEITSELTTAIVNSSNPTLTLGGGGVANKVLIRGGVSIQRKCYSYVQNNGNAKIGQVVATEAGQLPCEYILHAVGPIYSDGKNGEIDFMHQVVKRVFELAEELSLESISIPGISTGIYNFPRSKCAKITYQEIKKFLIKNPKTKLKLIRIVNPDTPLCHYFEEEFDKLGWGTSPVVTLDFFKTEKTRTTQLKVEDSPNDK